jgi:uncharacterized protein (TIGR03663 family)
MRRGAWWLLAAALALGAFLFHLPRLAERPMHTDEAVHAVKLGILLETGQYEYNPHEYHGPLIYYAALPFVWASGATTMAQIPDERPLRLPIVLFSALLVAAVVISGVGIGRLEAFVAAALFALSPAFAFYGRYYIQEVPFVFFCFVGLACAWQMLQTRRWRWAIAAGLATGCAIALKETWIMIMGAAALTALLLHMTTSTGLPPRPVQWKKFGTLVLASGALALFTGVVLLSNFFQSPEAVTHTFAALGGYVNRGISGDSSTFGSNVHDHPWYYYFQLLIAPPVDGPWLWTEAGTMALGLIGLVAAIGKWTTEPRPWHFIAIFTLLVTGFYSAIPYKTPWNVLPLFAGWTLLAGRGAGALLASLERLLARPGYPTALSRIFQAAVVLSLLAWAGCLAMQTYRATILRPADIRNPYAYSATSPNLLRLASRAGQIAAVAPRHHDMIIQVISPGNDYWPLPWYLRRFPLIGYYTDMQEASPAAAIIIATQSTETDAPTPELPASAGPRMQEFYGLRNDVMLSVYIQQDLWDKFMAANQ